MKEALGLVGVGLTLVGYVPYFIGIYKGTAKPHAFSWAIWGLLTTIAFFAQVSDGAGPGAWTTGLTALSTFTIAGLAVFKGERNITRSDRLTFICALAAIPLWYVTSNPLWSVILITAIDALGFFPTFRKSFHKPHEEVLMTYFLSSVKFIPALLALERFTMVTALYPASLVVMNGGFMLMVLWRRRVLRRA